MNREFSASRPDERLCTDVTEFKYGAGKKTYLSAIIDLYDGSIVTYRIGKSNNNGLVFQTMNPMRSIAIEDSNIPREGSDA